ncbi:MAG: site-specific DNA-methyltransferase [Candidatus Hydrogenedentes bacterium]|nr:site-specific DNA-methyltransferase [Candidatus Hydrogenedentota bacterium]
MTILLKRQIGNATLYCGDSLEVLPTLPTADVVITDPPYNAKTHAGARTTQNAKQVTQFEAVSDQYITELFSMLLGMTKHWVISTVAWQHLQPLEKAFPDEFIRAGVWVKPHYTKQHSGDRPATGWEAIAMLHPLGKKRWYGGDKSSVYYADPEMGYNQTQKPLKLVAEFVQDFSTPGETVLDPFMGSGTTGAACAKLGRKFIGIERDPRMFEIACKRIEEAYRSRQTGWQAKVTQQRTLGATNDR